MRVSTGIRRAYEQEWALAWNACSAGQLSLAFAHMERAHILGQRFTWLHVRSHIGMCRIGWLRRDLREVVGQLTRMVAAALFTRIWVPEGNTGGANVNAMRPMPIPEDLRAVMQRIGDD